MAISDSASAAPVSGPSAVTSDPYLRDQCMAATQQISRLLLDQRNSNGWWTGQLSTSALSTATACMALHLATVQRAGSDSQLRHWQQLLRNGLQWLIHHQNSDGGWGDTVLSISNISTSMLAHAVLVATTRDAGNDGSDNDDSQDFAEAIRRSNLYIGQHGGVEAVLQRYGKDRTFSVPILTHCALAGIVDWNRVIPLPFELACVPARFYAAIRLPVVSYALPALIAIGQVIFKHRGHWNPVVAAVRRTAIQPTLRVLESIQPPHGGFLEATPLTSFVCMSLLGCGHGSHTVTQRCLQFIQQSVRDDGSWPIDTNLSTWVTTLSINALSGGAEPGSDLHESVDRATTAISTSHHGNNSTLMNAVPRPLDVDAIRQWLLNQQYKQPHPYTNAAPGGWSWTDLPGGVPDADDTPGAMLALMNLRRVDQPFTADESRTLQNATDWLLNLQNRDGGWPTFCRGWGTLPFDRSSCDLTAHALRALQMWLQATRTGRLPNPETRKTVDDVTTSRSAHPHPHPLTRSVASNRRQRRVLTALNRGLSFLQKQQRGDGTWLPLWFGHQFNQDDENPLYGTAKVLVALAEVPFETSHRQQRAQRAARKAAEWLVQNQNDDGGWSARRGLTSSVEETGLAVEALTSETLRTVPRVTDAVDRGAAWLCARVNEGSVQQPTPIGFYFAKLWYFEALYPTIFAASGLIRWQKWSERNGTSAENKTG